MEKRVDLDRYSLSFASDSGNMYRYFVNSSIIISEVSLQSENRVSEIISLEEELANRQCNISNMDEDKAKNKVLTNYLSELILEMTTNCNMRCSYCIFGENYNQLREHGFKNIDFEIAKNAIDLYVSLLNEGNIMNPNRTAAISFYGGEPLINFPTIKKSVKYFKSIYKEDLYITMTSNGLLLTDEIIDFFIEENVTPLFSIDGPKIEHDKHRRTSKNEGSFEKAIKNIQKYAKRIKMPVFVTAVIDIDTDLRNVIEYFANSEDLIAINITPVSPINTDYYSKFTQGQMNDYQRTYHSLWKEYIEGIKKNDKDNKFLKVLDVLFARRCNSLKMRTIVQSSDAKGIPYTSTCIPGERLFVNIEGNIYPCERLSRSRDIGNVETGLDYAKIASYVNDYNTDICAKCQSCKIRKVCPSCFNNFLIDGKFESNNHTCQNFRESLLETLSMYVTICEADPEWLDVFRKKYYDDLKEMAVTLK